jgi:hypothetical protein
MELTERQQAGLKTVITKYNNHEKFAVISG